MTVGLQESKTQTGIKNDVKMIINKAIPSRPKVTLELDKTSQSIVYKNWKPENVESNRNKNKREKLKTKSDQNNAKLRWNHKNDELMKSIKNTPNKGNKIKRDSIEIQKKITKGELFV